MLRLSLRHILLAGVLLYLMLRLGLHVMTTYVLTYVVLFIYLVPSLYLVHSCGALMREEILMPRRTSMYDFIQN